MQISESLPISSTLPEGISFTFLKGLWVKLLPLALVWSLGYWISTRNYQVLVAIIGLTHYLVAAVYSKENLFSYFRIHNWGRLILMVALIRLVTLLHWPTLAVYFGVHHVFSEIYSPSGIDRHISSPYTRSVRFIFHTLCYLSFVLQGIVSGLPLWLTQELPLWIALAFAWIALVELSSNQKHSVQKSPRGEETSAFSTEFISVLANDAVMGVAAILQSFHPFFRIGLTDILLYHFLYWTFFPICLWARKPVTTTPAISSEIQMGKSPFTNLPISSLNPSIFPYLCLTFTIGILITSFFRNWQISDWTLDSLRTPNGLNAYYFLGYVHISLSFGISRHNPGWINSIMAPKFQKY